MPNQGSRIPRDIKSFIPYIILTDDHQLSIDPVTTLPRFKNWNWTPAESAAWTAFRAEADTLNLVYGTKALRNDDNTNTIHLLIDNVVAYDKLHRLLNRISDTPVPPAVLADFEKFNIKRGTPLEDTTPTSSDAEMGEPTLTIKSVEHLVHFLEVDGGRGLSNHIREVQVWRALVAGGAAEPGPDAYVSVDVAKRGVFKSVFSDGHKRMDAWYKARYKSTAGNFGVFCNPVSETVI